MFLCLSLAINLILIILAKSLGSSSLLEEEAQEGGMACSTSSLSWCLAFNYPQKEDKTTTSFIYVSLFFVSKIHLSGAKKMIFKVFHHSGHQIIINEYTSQTLK